MIIRNVEYERRKLIQLGPPLSEKSFPVHRVPSKKRKVRRAGFFFFHFHFSIDLGYTENISEFLFLFRCEKNVWPGLV